MRILTASLFVTRPRVSRAGSQSLESSHYSSLFITSMNDENKLNKYKQQQKTYSYIFLGQMRGYNVHSVSFSQSTLEEGFVSVPEYSGRRSLA